MAKFKALDVIEKFGEITGTSLAALGINLNFAPMVDLWFNDSENALRHRYWGKTAAEVITNSVAFLSGQNRSKVSGCLKHFPGLGKTEQDSHFALPINNSSRQELLEADLEHLPDWSISLQGARGKENLTQSQLSELSNIPQRHISEMENGKRPIGKERAKRLSAALKIDYRVLL
jgi:hypothetical protein